MPDMHKINPKLTLLRHAKGRITSNFLIHHPLNTTHLWLSGIEFQIKLVISAVPLFFRLDLKIFSKMAKTWRVKDLNNLLKGWRAGPEELQRLQQKLFCDSNVTPSDFFLCKRLFPTPLTLTSSLRTAREKNQEGSEWWLLTAIYHLRNSHLYFMGASAPKEITKWPGKNTRCQNT